MAAAASDELRYEETEALVQDVVAVFSDKSDVAAVRESSKAIADLHATQEADPLE